MRRHFTNTRRLRWVLIWYVVSWPALSQDTPALRTEGQRNGSAEHGNSFGSEHNNVTQPLLPTNVTIAQPENNSSIRALPLNQPVIAEIQPREQHVYRADYESGTNGGSVKLEARLVGSMPPTGERLTVSVQNSASAYLFTLPMVTKKPRAPQGNRKRTLHGEVLRSVSRILCPIEGATDSVFLTVDGPIAAGANSSYKYQIQLTLLNASVWFLNATGEIRSNNVTASAPAAYQFVWPEDGLDAVRVMVETGKIGCNKAGGKTIEQRRLHGKRRRKQPVIEDAGYNGIRVDEKACASLAIQHAVCPLTLTVDEILSAAQSLTFTECGSIVIKRKIVPRGFYLTVLMYGEDGDEKCYPNRPPRDALFTNSLRVKPVRVSVVPYQSHNAYILLPVALALLFIIIGSVSYYLKINCIDRNLSDGSSESVEMGNRAASTHPMSTLRVETSPRPSWRPDGESDVRTTVSQLYRVGTVVSHSSVLLTCGMIIVAIGFNSIVMDVILEMRTGNLDLCFRNDLCSHSLVQVPDFNHVLSNLPYIGAGLGFLIAVFGQRKRYLDAGGGGSPNALYGVPHDFSLFASLGAGLLLEGFTSALYHVCPNNRNSLIDFFFIYYIYAALGAKLFQTRRGVTQRFHFTPALMVATITLLGSVEYVAGRTYAWWATVVIIHIIASAIWSAMMYFHGDIGLYAVWQMPRRTVDHRTRRLAIAHLVLNSILGIVGLAAWRVFSEFTLYILIFFTLNAGVYLFYYMTMKKIRHQEHISATALVYLVSGVLVIIPALVLFVFYNPYNTAVSPAASRTANTGCFNDGFFDAHDVWHFLSAAALFFVMMGILTLDDDLLTVPRTRIPVF